MTPDPSKRSFVQSLERGLAVIEAFDLEHAALSVTDVAHRTGITRAAARRFLLTLTELGYMRNDDGVFSLRPRVLGLGYAYLSSLSLPQLASPHLRDLAEATGESASLSVLDDQMITYVAQVTAPRPMAIRIDVGTRFPAYATSMGRVLLSELSPQELDDYFSKADLVALTASTVTAPDDLRALLGGVRNQEFALVEKELDSSLRALAIPVRGESGAVVASMGISTHTQAADPKEITRVLLPSLRAAADALTRDIIAGS